MSDLKTGDCEHCERTYRYSLYHCGFGDISYAYCDTLGELCTLDYWSKGLPTWPPGCGRHQEICADLESALKQCPCGGHFKKGASPRCPHCRNPLSATHAARHIERNSPGTAKGWRWQGNWFGTYCLAIEDPLHAGTMRVVKDPYKEPDEAVHERNISAD
jgi:hypothetical protein